MPGPSVPPGTPGDVNVRDHAAATPIPPWPRWASYWLPIGASVLFQVIPAAFLLRAAVVGWPMVAPGPRQALVGFLVAVLGPIALAFARRFPGPVVAVTAAASALDLVAGPGSGPPYVALAFAAVGAIVRGARIWAWVSVGAAWAVTLLVSALLGHEGWTPLRVIGMTLGILIVLGVGEALRGRRERAAEHNNLLRQRRQSEVRAERARIARELHDVLAHSLSQINVQASVGLHLLDRQPEKAQEALASIKETSKSALDEVRAVLGLLDADEGGVAPPLVPEPDLSRLAGLIDSAAAEGVPVALIDTTTHAAIPGPVQLAVYRIVQESLTNIRRHARDLTRVTVSLHADAGMLHLDVHDDGRPGDVASETGGRGLLGMRERAELLGGHLSAGPASEGGFRVSARIPVRRTTRADPDPTEAS